MPNKVAVDQQAKDMIIELGLLIRDCRGTLSQSQLAKRVSLPRSNMKYIEDGVNAPTAEVYDKLIKELKPDLQTRRVWIVCIWRFGKFLRRIFVGLSHKTRIW